MREPASLDTPPAKAITESTPKAEPVRINERTVIHCRRNIRIARRRNQCRSRASNRQFARRQ